MEKERNLKQKILDYLIRTTYIELLIYHKENIIKSTDGFQNCKNWNMLVHSWPPSASKFKDLIFLLVLALITLEGDHFRGFHWKMSKYESQFCP